MEGRDAQPLTRQRGQNHWVRVYTEDRVFLEEESLRLRQEGFRRTRRLTRLPLADTVAALLRELRAFREACSCGAAEAGSVAFPARPAGEGVPAAAPDARAPAAPLAEGPRGEQRWRL